MLLISPPCHASAKAYVYDELTIEMSVPSCDAWVVTGGGGGGDGRRSTVLGTGCVRCNRGGVWRKAAVLARGKTH